MSGYAYGQVRYSWVKEQVGIMAVTYDEVKTYQKRYQLSQDIMSKVNKVVIPVTARISHTHNNPGNLRFAGQSNARPGYGFAKFDTSKDGFRALVQDLLKKQKDGLTLEEMIYKYAPPSENETDKYLMFLEAVLVTDKDKMIRELDTLCLAGCIAYYESGTVVLTNVNAKVEGRKS